MVDFYKVKVYHRFVKKAWSLNSTVIKLRYKTMLLVLISFS